MAYIKYTGEEALGRVAEYVNKKLAFASTMPSSPDANTIILYVGADTSSYSQGGIYQYDGTDWNLINLVRTIELTQAEYDALPYAAKHNGAIYFVTDGSADGSIISGYYNETDGEFYAEETYETQYSHHHNTIYIDLANNTTYIYDFENEEYVQVGGSGAGTVIKYVNTLPVTGIEDIIYGIKGYNSFEETIADGFLDENVLFEKEDDLSGGYIYTPAEDVVLDASDDGTTYKGFTSLAYDGTSDWTLTFDDTTDATLADGDTFYFRQPVDKFFAGDATNQKVIPFGSAGGGGDYAPGEGITINNQVISVVPATNSTLGGIKPDDETLKVDGITGTLSGNYEGGFNVKIDGNTISTKTFVGTLEEWNNLTSAQKAKFDTVSITDDSSPLSDTPGHSILDNEATPFPQRANLQFDDFNIVDDDENNATKISSIPYTAGDGIDIDEREISVTEDRPSIFIGTTAEWEALTPVGKNKYQLVNLTDDGETVNNIFVIVHAGVNEVVTIDNIHSITMNSKGEAVASLSAGIHTLVGSLSEKTFEVIVNGNTTNIYCMPNNGEGILYWFGAELTPLMFNRQTYGATLTRDTNRLIISKYASTTTNNFILTPTYKINLNNYSKINTIIQYGDTASSYQHLGYGTTNTSDAWPNSTQIIPSTTKQEASYNFASGIGEQYCGYETNGHPNGTYIYALWLDPR